MRSTALFHCWLFRCNGAGTPGGEEEDKHGWMKEVCDVVDDSIPEVRGCSSFFL